MTAGEVMSASGFSLNTVTRHSEETGYSAEQAAQRLGCLILPDSMRGVNTHPTGARGVYRFYPSADLLQGVGL